MQVRIICVSYFLKHRVNFKQQFNMYMYSLRHTGNYYKGYIEKIITCKWERTVTYIYSFFFCLSYLFLSYICLKLIFKANIWLIHVILNHIFASVYQKMDLTIFNKYIFLFTNVLFLKYTS